MSLIWPASESDIQLSTPRLHVFIIGVAHYPHLPGGGGDLALNPLQLRQVTTPQYTAARMAEWFRDEYRNPDVPLGSIELLISKSLNQSTTAAWAVMDADPATLDGISASFKKWQARASSDPGNIAIFYFCGHGVMKGGNHYLLAADWGNPALAEAWENTIDFDAMRVGMRSCRAQTQLFFIDACRETPPGLLKEIPRGHRFISADETASVKSSAVYNAAAEKQQAFGPKDGPTYFSQALLTALKVGAQHRADGSWVVDIFSLTGVLGTLMASYGKRHGAEVSCSAAPAGEPSPLHHVGGGSVLAIVGCTNKDANAVAEIVMKKDHTATVHSAVGDTKPIFTVVEEGEWTIDVCFPGREFSDRRFTGQRLRPPIFEGVAAP